MRRGFTLIELLVVVGLLVVLMSLAYGLTRGEKQDSAVSGAAQELAATLRKARSLALERKGIYAVAFNIANPVGMSGAALCNRTGGHWYRIIGPDEFNASRDNNGSPTYPLATRNVDGVNGPGAGRDKAVPPTLQSIQRAWVGERHVLPPGKVRFLALMDQDNGSFMDDGDTYPATYPRPWCGWFDPAARRLYTWGGYDPTLLAVRQTAINYTEVLPRSVGGKVISHSGFFYEGDDGAISGCANPKDRWIFTDNSPVKDGWYWHTSPTDPTYQDQPGGTASASAANGWLLLKRGEARPLINGDWLDYTIVFYPDGTVQQGPFLGLRAAFGGLPGSTTVFKPQSGNIAWLGPGDMCNQTGGGSRRAREEATSYEARSGTWWITLAPDGDGTDRFDDAAAALRSLMPAYRVGINRLGDVRVARVSNSPRKAVLLTQLTGANWNVKTQTDAWTRGKLLVDRTGRKVVPLGTPVETFITTDMLLKRSWWVKQ